MKKIWVILIVLFIVLIFSVYSYVYTLVQSPENILIAKFKDSPPIGHMLLREGIGAFYRGYLVGKVYNVTLSEDQKYIVFYINMFYSNLRLPKNTIVTLRTNGVFGDKLIELEYPDNPSTVILSNRSIVEGTTVFERLDEYIVKELGKGNVKKLLLSITDLANDMSVVLNDNKEEVNKFLKEFTKSGNNANQVLNTFRAFLENPQIQRDIQDTLKYSSKSVKDISEIVGNRELKTTINSAPQKFDATLKNFDSVKENISSVNLNISKATENVPETTQTLNKTLKTYDCIGKGISDILSKRFLGFRLMFGLPGSSLEKCK
ncbi:MAG: MlaD family protein [Candidatus Gastranaerophilales bacterium]|nr:MlaD family protein [Candidatus Gastranaerophilales bacterium]